MTPNVCSVAQGSDKLASCGEGRKMSGNLARTEKDKGINVEERTETECTGFKQKAGSVFLAIKQDAGVNE